ncbi:hypothetical protein ATCC53582_02271 [Novacetimonas hansenii]|nr:hypothetical protein ATCC53582_02271 [Novacetimonas hansenii]
MAPSPGFFSLDEHYCPWAMTFPKRRPLLNGVTLFRGRLNSQDQ